MSKKGSKKITKVPIRPAGRDLLIASLIFYAAALAIRLIFLLEIRSMPTFDYPIMDEQYHVELARQIDSPEGLPREPFFRAPLYPYFLALTYKLTGGSLFWCRFIQILIASLVPVLLMHLGLKLFNRKIAYISGAIAVFYPTFIYYDNTLLITFVEVLTFLLVVYQLYRCQEKPNALNFILTGGLLGLGAVARPNFLLLVPFLLVWVWLIVKPQIGLRNAITRYLLFVAAAALIIMPVTIRNYLVSNEFVPIAWQGGFNFYIGNNIHASGWSATVPGIDPSWQGGYKEMISIAEYDSGRKLLRSEVSDYWYGKALKEIIENPGHFAKMTFLKARLFLNGFEIPNQHEYIIRSFAPILAPILFDYPVFFPYGVLAPLAIIGLAFSLSQWRTFLVIYLSLTAYTISFLLFFVCARFRQPLIPILIMFAVFGVAQVIRLIKSRNYQITAVCLAALALLLVESNHYILDLTQERVKADGQYYLGSAYLTLYKESVRGQDDPPLLDPLPMEIVKARLHLNQAIAADSSLGLAYNDLGTIAMRRRRWDEAIGLFQRAEAADSTRYQPFINHFMVHARNGRVAVGVGILERAKIIFPFNEEIFFDLGIAYLQMNEKEKAGSALEACLRINPANQQARNALSYLRQLPPGQ
ncbi:MAG: hypothetical protein A2W25_05730 [candidate division Zixibacteria bacterium RBG_16_53_22]|nr:MAG: hypothetical protein A2W25_05730 [candidate division Zixibacteria bacterium RBG_16_53_22]